MRDGILPVVRVRSSGVEHTGGSCAPELQEERNACATVYLGTPAFSGLQKYFKAIVMFKKGSGSEISSDSNH